MRGKSPHFLGMFEQFLQNTVEFLGDGYVDAIFNRPKGSKWHPLLTREKILALDWVNFIPHPSVAMSDCQYFQARGQQFGKEHIKLLSYFHYEEVRLSEGLHGKELIAIKPFPAEWVNDAHLIIYYGKQKPVLASAFPGKLTCSVKKYPQADLSELLRLATEEGIPFAVKSPE